MSNLVPTTIFDKNGVRTTRNKKLDATPVARPRLNGAGAAPPSPGKTQYLSQYKLDLIRALELQRTILRMNAADVPFEELKPLIAERDSITNRRQEVPFEVLPHDDGTGDRLPLDVVIPSSFSEPGIKYGYNNGFADSEAERDALNETMCDISIMWLDSCSTASAHALSHYTGSGSVDYAIFAAARKAGEKTSHPVWDAFESAVAISPITEQPFVAFSGVNEFYVDDILEQVESGEVRFDRVMSASLNPAQVNGFATGETHLAIEVETNHAAFIEVFAGKPYEMEVLLPKGRYEVVSEEGETMYSWSRENLSGIKIDRVVRLRYLGD